MDVVRAIEILYAIGERDLIAGGLADLGERSMDMATLAAVGEVAARHKDARAMVLLGKAALGRGLPLEQFAFPTVGIPDYRAIGPEVEPGIVYAIARQESSFNPRAISSARAVGLMQVTPAAGRYVANKFGVPYDEKRLLNDQTYNVQLGAAELGDLIKYYRGSYILSFAGYNAGRGRVKDWIAKYGDPRDPKIDPIDWVERIPFSETRNYVQRVLENLQVYRVRFGGGSKLLIEADLRRGAQLQLGGSQWARAGGLPKLPPAVDHGFMVSWFGSSRGSPHTAGCAELLALFNAFRWRETGALGMYGRGSRGPTRHVCSICSVVRTRDRVAGAGYACSARPDLHPSAAHFLKSHQLLCKSLRRIEIGKKAASSRDGKCDAPIAPCAKRIRHSRVSLRCP